MKEEIKISRLGKLVDGVGKKYRYVYVLEENYTNAKGNVVNSLDLEGETITGKNIIAPGDVDRNFEWNGEKFDPNWDIILPNYKGITDCIATG